MEFSNLYFLYIWLPLILAVYFLMPDMRRKNLFLIGCSLFLYAMGQPVWVVLLLGLGYGNFRIAGIAQPGDRKRLILSLILNLGTLGLFKYLGFFPGFSQDSGVPELVQKLTAIQPLGISFYVFSLISYQADIYRGTITPETEFKKFLLYLTLFPKLAQGPIVRCGQIRHQLSSRKEDPQGCFEGGLRFVCGLAKKVLLADYCGAVIGELTAVQADGCFVGAWLSALMYMFRIYYDFSGYCDMAIGLGQIFGFSFCENFDLPYTAASVTEFWRRWHISLGTFFRDYVYIPLGGNRKGLARQVLNLLTVWLLTGLWHGGSWNYILWGFYFFVLLALEKCTWNRLERIPMILRRSVTQLLVLIGWVIFSHEDSAAMGSAFASMLGLHGFLSAGAGLKLLNALPLIAVCAAGCTRLPQWLAGCWQLLCGVTDDTDQPTLRKTMYPVGMFLLMCLLLWLCTVSLVGSTSAPSIYSSF